MNERPCSERTDDRQIGEAPSLSIVTISFNQARFLEECLLSVLSRQASCEYIIVDPGSTDGSRDILARYTEQTDIQVLDPDRGPADGLNKGFAMATGDVFGYINSDDRLRPGSIQFVQKFFAKHPQVDVLCGSIRLIDGQGSASLRSRTADRFDLTRYAGGICTVGQQATFFRRSAFERAGGFNAENRVTWDGELLVDMALSGARFATVRKVLGDFRIHAESITGSNKHRAQALREHERVADKIRSRGIRIYTPLETIVQRAIYKLNVVRHASYLLAR